MTLPTESLATALALSTLLLVLGCTNEKPTSTVPPNTVQISNEADHGDLGEMVSSIGDDSKKAIHNEDGEAVTPTGEFSLNEENRFSIFLPTDWMAIDASSLQDFSESLSGPNAKIVYVAGYQMIEHEPFAHPLVLVRLLPERTMPRTKLKEMQKIFQESDQKITHFIENESNMKMEIELGKPVLEEETGIVWIKSQLTGPENQLIDVIMAHYYRNGEILQFIAATTETRGNLDWPILMQMLKTVHIQNN